MRFGTANQTILLFVGDLLILVFSLWLTLILRYLEVPTADLLLSHLIPFSFIFLLWTTIFFMYDLYGKITLFLDRKLISAVINAQIINIIIALLFFYFIPYFGITPKTILFIFLIISGVSMYLWRRFGVSLVVKPASESILFACSAPEVDELKETFKANPSYQVKVQDGGPTAIPQAVSMIIFNSHDESSGSLFSNFYNLLFSGIRFTNIEDIYEEVYGRVPVSIISERWFLEHISNHPKPIYDFGKRAMDIVVGLILGVVSLLIYPLVAILIKIEDAGPVFIRQERVGKGNKPLYTYKFRSMTRNEIDLTNQGNNKVTKVGNFLRKTRIDELPQLWSVVKGDMSLIGPRPELPSGVERYSLSVPYYNIRHIIKPGLSGWAQVYHERHPHHGLDIVETKNKLSYDLYYIKHRSLWLDINIALKTIALLLSVKGS